jgi:hypothetical protein
MSRKADSAARGPRNSDQPTHERQELEDQLTQEQFDGELENDVDLILTQDQCDEEQERAEGRGEADEDEEEDDDDEDSSGGYESPEDPHPQPPRQKPTEDTLDLDFNPDDEVWMEPL